jgi:hypothetical protein
MKTIFYRKGVDICVRQIIRLCRNPVHMRVADWHGCWDYRKRINAADYNRRGDCDNGYCLSDIEKKKQLVVRREA